MEQEQKMLEELCAELRCIALGSKAYPEYDKNGLEQMQLPSLASRLKAMEMLHKMLAAGRSGRERRALVVDDL
ncbi:hypothetical protein [uncultured Allofournierella sp.]|uniref:hypothetical protein n=1 Tax=uncultured Allofournierella sp. TaxID=1940258 RepID=UPI0037500BCA